MRVWVLLPILYDMITTSHLLNVYLIAVYLMTVHLMTVHLQGYVAGGDATDVLEKGYWSSYNGE